MRVLANKKPKIALMSHSMDNRRAKGTALYTKKLVEGLIAQNDFHVTLVHYEKVNDPLYKKADAEIIMPHINLPYGSNFIQNLLFYFKYRNKKFDIIHWFQTRLHPFFWFAPARRLIISVHDAADVVAPSRFVFSKFIFNLVLKYFNKYLNAAIVGTASAGEEVAEHYQIDKKKIFITPYGGSEDFQPVKSEAAKKAVKEKHNIKTPFMLDLARPVPHKNVENLLKGYRLAQKKYSVKHKLIIVGGNKEEYKEVAPSIEKIESGSVQFLNYIVQEDLNALYSAADLFIFPSLHEGFGLPIIEAMASGTPVVTSAVTAMPEVAGDAALLVDPRDPEDIARAVHEVLSSENLQKKMIARGLARAQKFTWDVTVNETIKVYKKMLYE